MSIEAEVRALTTEKGRLRARALNAVAAVEQTLKNHADNVLIPELKVYPPATPGRRSKRTGRFIKGGYKRTFELRRHWGRTEVLNTGNDLLLLLLNDVTDTRGKEYAALVQDARKQVSVHRGRWTNTVQAVRQRNSGKLQTAISKAFKQAMQG